jgi:diguanylate cyclase (GGDEF)-like protein
MSAEKPETPLCEQFGFDAGWRQAQLLLVGLDACPDDQVRQLHEQVLAHEVVEQVVERFFAQLMRHAQAAELLSSFDLDHLKERQVAYFDVFGVNCRSAEYFESRALMGIAHARVGVPLSLYLSAFGLLQALLLDAIVERLGDEAGRQALAGLVTRLITLDIALAAEVYHRVEVLDADSSVRPFQRQQTLLRKQLEQDALTGASSRTSLLHEMQDALKRAAKTGQPLCLIMADPDNFKVVNDSHGHLVGDKVLEEVAARIKAALREFDVVGRFGGEEFVILLENTSRHTAQQIAERIRQRIAADPIRVAGQSLQLTISQGLAVRRDGDDDHTLLQRADAAMYQAKQRGRNCVAEEPGYAARR